MYKMQFLAYYAVISILQQIRTVRNCDELIQCCHTREMSKRQFEILTIRNENTINQ